MNPQNYHFYGQCANNIDGMDSGTWQQPSQNTVYNSEIVYTGAPQSYLDSGYQTSRSGTGISGSFDAMGPYPHDESSSQYTSFPGMSNFGDTKSYRSDTSSYQYDQSYSTQGGRPWSDNLGMEQKGFQGNGSGRSAYSDCGFNPDYNYASNNFIANEQGMDDSGMSGGMQMKNQSYFECNNVRDSAYRGYPVRDFHYDGGHQNNIRSRSIQDRGQNHIRNRHFGFNRRSGNIFRGQYRGGYNTGFSYHPNSYHFRNSFENTSVKLSRSNFNTWGYLRKNFRRNDDELFEHLLACHDKCCGECKKMCEERKSKKRKSGNDADDKFNEQTDENEAEEELTAEEKQMRDIMGFSGFSSTKGLKAKHKDESICAVKCSEEPNQEPQESSLTEEEKKMVIAAGGYSVSPWKNGNQVAFGAPAVIEGSDGAESQSDKMENDIEILHWYDKSILL